MHCCQSNWSLMIGEKEEEEETATFTVARLHCKNHLFEMINDHQRILHIIIVVVLVVAKKWIWDCCFMHHNVVSESKL